MAAVLGLRKSDVSLDKVRMMWAMCSDCSWGEKSFEFVCWRQE
jgi:hypothetical protein